MNKTTIFLIIFFIVSCSSNNNNQVSVSLPYLDSIDISSDVFFPSFKKDTFHYAALCDSEDLSVQVVLSDNVQDVFINGNSLSSNFVLTDLSIENDIHIQSSNASTDVNYYIHCIDEDFPEITFSERDIHNLDSGYFLMLPRYKKDDIQFSYLLIIDNNGVPRYRKKLNKVATDFKLHNTKNSIFYSYAERTGKNEFGFWDNDIVIMDVFFNEINRLNTSGLNHTDNHDFLVTEENTFILMSYNSSIRDLSEYGLSSTEATRDSVIQEIDEDGNILMEWNSWNALDLDNCQQHRWPDDYAHINSVSISDDGNLILSLRGCSQIIKIDRKSGDTIWKLNGTDSDFVIRGDPYEEFCGQHTAKEIGQYLYIFDNGGYCLSDREESYGQFSRALQYRLDYNLGYADFVSDYSMNSSYLNYTPSGGSLEFTPEGNWLINWAVRDGDDHTVTEITPDGDIALKIKIKKDEINPRTYRVYKEENILFPISINNETFFEFSE